MGDLLAAKRLLADYKGAPGKTTKSTDAADEQGVAFAEGGKGTEHIPTCHGCGRKCKGGWRKCQHITDEHRAKVAALDTAGHFRRNNNNNKSKKGTVNVAAAASEDDGDDDDRNNNSKTEDSTALC